MVGGWGLMRSLANPLALLAALLCPTTALADGHLAATLMLADSGNPSTVSLIIANDGDKPVSFYKYTTPVQLLDGVHLPNKQFIVTEKNTSPEKEVAYSGMWMHPTHIEESEFVTIDPGKRISMTYDVTSDYRLQAGKVYKVPFHANIEGSPTDKAGNPVPNHLSLGAQKELQSNSIDIAVLEATQVETKSPL